MILQIVAADREYCPTGSCRPAPLRSVQWIGLARASTPVMLATAGVGPERRYSTSARGCGAGSAMSAAGGGARSGRGSACLKRACVTQIDSLDRRKSMSMRWSTGIIRTLTVGCAVGFLFVAPPATRAQDASGEIAVGVADAVSILNSGDDPGVVEESTVDDPASCKDPGGCYTIKKAVHNTRRTL